MSGKRPALIKRVRRRLWGGLVDVRFYADGSSRIRVDHPSNDPEIELAMGGAAYRVLRDACKSAGIEAKLGPINWRDDPLVEEAARG